LCIALFCMEAEMKYCTRMINRLLEEGLFPGYFWLAKNFLTIIVRVITPYIFSEILPILR